MLSCSSFTRPVAKENLVNKYCDSHHEMATNDSHNCYWSDASHSEGVHSAGITYTSTTAAAAALLPKSSFSNDSNDGMTAASSLLGLSCTCPYDYTVRII